MNARLKYTDTNKEIACNGDKNNGSAGRYFSEAVITEKLELEDKARRLAENEKRQVEDINAKVNVLLPVVNAVARGGFTRVLTVTEEDAFWVYHKLGGGKGH